MKSVSQAFRGLYVKFALNFHLKRQAKENGVAEAFVAERKSFIIFLGELATNIWFSFKKQQGGLIESEKILLLFN